MREDELMDGLLRETLSTEPPRLPDSFDAAVMRRVRPRTLTTPGRVALALYGGVSMAVAVWVMSDLPPALVGLSMAAVAVTAAGVSAYVRTLTRQAHA